VIVLGLNGWIDRTHDPAAVVTIDGRVAAFVEQERLSRHKHGIGELPHEAVRTALDLADVRPGEVDELAYGWDLPLFNGLRGRDVDLDDLAVKLTGLTELSGRPVQMALHHDAHAASAFYGSGLERAAVLVVDAEGENESATIFSADSSGLRRLRTFGRGRSLGLMYRAVSIFCGFGAFGAGKTMGLAPYHIGEIEPLPLLWDGSSLQSPIPEAAWEDDVVARWLALLSERFGPACTASGGRTYPPLEVHHPAAAAAAQAAVNEALGALVNEALALTGYRDLCLSGGVALNCVANGLLLDRVRSLHIPPYPHDAGVALGAAQLAGLRAGQRWTDSARAQTGPPAGSVAPHARRAALPWRETDDPAATAADALLSGATVGWVHGGMEVGPRALGHRSILALPDRASTRERINARKGREPWRPLAPSLLREDAPELLDRDLNSPFMLVSVPLSEKGRAVAPAAAHCDGSARVQTVSAQDDVAPTDPWSQGPAADARTYRRILERLKAATGHGVLLDTSLNSRGEPIVHTAEQALAAAILIGLDVLIVDDVVVVLPGAEDHP
jgi:carbamoyltransferase